MKFCRDWIDDCYQAKTSIFPIMEELFRMRQACWGVIPSPVLKAISNWFIGNCQIRRKMLYRALLKSLLSNTYTQYNTYELDICFILSKHFLDSTKI